eukprot:scaffold981_cov70-Skeletonema_dohrnii-CCMP3373.AAC.2
MFTATPPRSSIGTDEQHISAAAAVSLQRKRARPDQLFQASSPAHLGQGQFQCHVNNDVNISSGASSSSSSSLAGNPTAMVSPYINHRTSSINVGGMIAPLPVTTRLEPLIECAPQSETCATQHHQQQLPLPQTSLVSTASSINTFASSIHNNADYHHLEYYHQPPMKRVKVDRGGTKNDEELQDVVIPLEECHDDDEEMSHDSPDHSQSAKSSNSLMKKLMEGGNNASSLTTKNDASYSSSGVECCHVCGGQGDGATTNGARKGCAIGSSSSSSGSRASRSIASYFQVTKKQSLSSKLPSQPSASSRKAFPQHATTKPNNNNNHHLPPCRYCDRPTCNNNPSCIKQCEECQHNFCSFCCKVNYDGMYEKTVCFECDELLMLSHCCDRMEL